MFGIRRVIRILINTNDEQDEDIRGLPRLISTLTDVSISHKRRIIELEERIVELERLLNK